MIQDLLISNIRLFEGPEEWRIDLSPLTVFCGANSAGKSTILKTLLLLCQTHADANTSGALGRVRLAGGVVDFGAYQSVVSHNKTDQDIMFGLTIHDSMQARHLHSLYRVRGLTDLGADLPSLTSELEYNLSVRFTCGLRGQESSEPKSNLVPAVSGPRGTAVCCVVNSGALGGVA